MELKIQNITKRYRDKTAVDDVSITLTPGVWGLLGANGAGKTTLMRMLAGILRPSSGRILCDGVEIGTLGAAYREKLGYLPQEFGFYPEFTVQDLSLIHISFGEAVKAEKSSDMSARGAPDIERKIVRFDVLFYVRKRLHTVCTFARIRGFSAQGLHSLLSFA